MSEAEERARVVAEALSWSGTPYHSAADVKGVGVDCVFLLIRAFADTGMIAAVDPRPFPEQWHVHQAAERYLEGIQQQNAHEVAGPPARSPQPADVILFKFGRVFSHGAIVVAWPNIIHVRRPLPVMVQNCERTWILDRLDKKFFSLWPRR
jgi:cell wall-associated NlpC family hydrolase